MTQLEVYQAMRKMHNRSAIVVRNGKVYTTKLNPLTMDKGTDYIDVSFLKRSRVAKTILEHYPLPADWTDRYGKSYGDAYRFSQISMRVPKSDFIVEKL